MVFCVERLRMEVGNADRELQGYEAERRSATCAVRPCDARPPVDPVYGLLVDRHRRYVRR
jgi:hypothetical protein